MSNRFRLAQGEKATAIKLRGSVELSDIEERIKTLEIQEQSVMKVISELTIEQASKKEIEKQRIKLIQIGGMIEGLIAAADDKEYWIKI